MPRLDPLPYVRESRPRNLRLADLYLRQGEAQAEAERRRGDIQAQLWGNVGRVAGETGAAIINAPRLAREQADAAATAAQEREARGLQIGEAKRQINERENFDLAMGAGSRQKTLEALKGRPELYEKAQAHFTKIDTSMKQLLGDAAAGIADFGYTPEAAMAAMDDLMEQGFDERKIEPFRAAIQQNPEAVKQIVTSLLSQSPDPRHQAMAKPQPLVELNRDTSLYDPNQGKVVASGPASPAPREPNPTEASLAMAAAAGDAQAKEALRVLRAQHPPQGPAGGEPLESVIDPKTGDAVLMPRSQARGMRPATTREQPTEDERKTAGFHRQMTEAIAVLDEVEKDLTPQDLYQIQSLPQEDLVGLMNRGKMSEAAKRYIRAFEQFTEARLRPVSGAAISDSEFARDRRTYAKQYGETAQLNADRRAARSSALESLKTRASRALPKGSGTVTMIAPDGTEKSVSASEVEHYKSLGAKVKGQ